MKINEELEYAIYALNEYSEREERQIFSMIACFIEQKDVKAELKEFIKKTDWDEPVVTGDS